MGVSVLHASLSQCKHSVAHSCRTQGERSVKARRHPLHANPLTCQPVKSMHTAPGLTGCASWPTRSHPRDVPHCEEPLRGGPAGSQLPMARSPGPLHCDRPLMYGGAGRGVDWAGPVGRRGVPLGASTESRRGSSSPPARRRLAPVEGAGWPVAVVLQRLMVHGPCNAQHTLLSHGTSLQRAAASSQSATTLLHTSDSLVGSEMQRRRDCNHLHHHLLHCTSQTHPRSHGGNCTDHRPEQPTFESSRGPARIVWPGASAWEEGPRRGILRRTDTLLKFARSLSTKPLA